MKKVIILKGLPASGKSTWAKQQIDKHPGKYARVNKDDLRSMLHNSKWSKHNEKLVLKIRDQIILSALEAGQHVIVDDTNLHPKHVINITNLVKGIAEVEEKMFDIDVNEAVKRDLKRPNSVGAKVIEDMYKSFLAPPDEVYIPPKGTPAAIICDIDGTLAHMVDRKPYDWERVGEDLIDVKVLELLNRYKDDHSIILLSGRDGICKPETLQWLKEYKVPCDGLFMRAPGDMRKDYEVKRELYDKHVRDQYRVQFVLDDRNQVVDLWRSLGLTCYQVADGDF